MRTDRELNIYLSKVESSLKQQVEWIKAYKKRETNKLEFYFIIENTNSGRPCGTVRVYDLRTPSFCWGSWILNQDKSRLAAVESAFLVYEFGFNHLGYESSHFEVMKGNTRVISFHEKFGAARVSEDEEYVYFNISNSAVEKYRIKFQS